MARLSTDQSLIATSSNSGQQEDNGSSEQNEVAISNHAPTKLTRTPIPSAVRSLIVTAIKANGTPDSVISQLYGVPRTTVGSIRRAMDAGRETASKRGGSRRTILTEEHKRQVIVWVDENCTLKIPAIRSRILSELGVAVSATTVSRLLAEFHYSVKRVSFIPAARNSSTTIDRRFEYARYMFSIARTVEKVFYLDESGFQFTMRSRYGRSLIGTRANLRVPQIRSQNVSCAAAISQRGVLHFKLSFSAFNTMLFSEFVQQVIEKLQLANIDGAILICDNVAFHHSTCVSQLVENAGHKLVFLPPYSPFLNPIEEVFSQWKRLVAAAMAKDAEELKTAIESAAGQITADNCINYIKHSETYYDACIVREEIEN